MAKQLRNIIKTIADTLERIEPAKSQYLTTNIGIVDPTIVQQTADSRIELHVYAADTWITGIHQTPLVTNIPTYRDKKTNAEITYVSVPVAIDVYSQLASLNLTAGNFNIVVNFFKNLIGSYEKQYLRIDEISPDRTEVRLRAIDDNDPTFLRQIANYIKTVKPTSAEYFETYLLNFSRNRTATYVNSVVIGDYLYVKLKQPLDDTIAVDFKCWVVLEQKASYVDSVAISAVEPEITYNKLANPNWQANYSYNTSAATGFKTWNQLLGSSTQTSQQIIDSYFSGSLAGIKLNIDYSDFNNFIFYSSATERLENFRYKLELLEYYTTQRATILAISGSVATTNAADYANQKTALISGFDAFEQYLYYQSGSRITTFDAPHPAPNVASVTGSYVTPVPKTNSTYPYTLAATTSTTFNTWYNALYETASLYDSLNNNQLINAVPEYMRLDQLNLDLTTFVNMLGHHYDIVYTYINHMTHLNKREENPKLGMPNELLYSVAKQYGWNLTDGKQSHDIWKYLLGTDENGTPLTGSKSVKGSSLPGKEQTYAVWRRIVNNLPLLLKSKGTKRSVQALLSCYGIPQSFISINEYGGPRLDRAPVYQKLNFDYALDLIKNPSGSVTINYTKPIQSVELRFRLDNVVSNPTMSGAMNLYTIGSNRVDVDFTSGTLGKFRINGTASANMEIFDGGWISTLLRTNGTNLDFIAKRSKYGKIVAAVSSSATASFASSGTLTLGSGSAGYSRLQGQLQELRLWTSSLQDSPFNNHVKAPSAYDANSDAYSELVFRLPLTENINHTATSSLQGIQPVSSTISASFIGWTNTYPYDSIEETYYYDAVSLGSGTHDDNKIRIEDNELIGPLDVITRAERSQFDKAPIDSNRLGVYFSPQTMINEDIFAQLGFVSLDEYIGDPGKVNAKSYPELQQFAQTYWKKYSSRNDINAYLNMFTLFDMSFFKQLEQLLPARANKVTGLLIQPNVLERSKDSILPDLYKSVDSYESVISMPTASSAEFMNYETSISDITTITAESDGNLQGYITGSRYSGFTYTRTSLIRSGSTWIEATTPYWINEALPPNITGSVSRGLQPQGLFNSKFAGTRMTSRAFNVKSKQTIDGGPVVEWRNINGTQLFYQPQGGKGNVGKK